MDTEGTHDAPGAWATPVTPASPPPPPPLPPTLPSQAPAPPARSPLAGWLNMPRQAEAPGIWKYGHQPRPPQAQPDAVADRQLLVGALIALLSGILIWTLWWNGYIPYWRVPMKLVTPADWWNPGLTGGPRNRDAIDATIVYQGLFAVLLIYGFGRLGNWNEVFRRFVGSREQPFRATVTVLAAALAQWAAWTGNIPVTAPVLILVPDAWLAGGGNRYLAALVVYLLYALITAALLWPFARLGDWAGAMRLLLRRRPADGAAQAREHQAPPAPGVTAADWPELREAGRREAADRLAADLTGGRMNDVDCVRVRRAWSAAQRDPARMASFADTVRQHGAAAFAHPSGDRDLPSRTATHDVLAGQVRIGSYADDDRNPYQCRGSGVALEPALLGTSLLAVGPPGAGKTRRLVRPVVESLSLQALAGQCGVIVVCAAGTPLGPDEAYDVVVKLGDAASVHDLDLYGGTSDVDEAAAVLAEGLVGDLGGVDSRRAATALAQLLGPYHAAHGRFPTVPELCELLHGTPSALEELRQTLEASDDQAMLRELASHQRHRGSTADPCAALADRLFLLDRPAFAGFFATGKERPFSLRAMRHHPLRVRVDLPERGHPEASRLFARLILAQFTAMAVNRADPSLFTCLVLDDAVGTLTADTVRGIRRLRSANAGVVLGLRTIDDVAEQLHKPLLGAVGCHLVLSGVTTWDGKQFSEAWGTQWVETREVAEHAVFADQPFTRAVHAVRKMVTGKTVTRNAVTVRKVERDRWSASDLAHAVPAGHAVLSLTTVRGEHAPPLLVDLRS
ncbi:ATP/GTP-binding protein [Streptomyces sp. ISL-96]|uniref:ATP/GTP-binding protein n=1 Tax=Streptomyces sp. ISL-96 TaxID=2819191 RepID=UPI001BED2222|nr:ATP/GTP-binding protein [Streptomyces sp. ISL-96]MBT2491120.1 ATP/GTP-binding protein [Streptomyces sp. ISL-96]